ncbi:Protein-L-isoaspartate(D-aspartate) O-methyltransferase [Apiospora phragmitis]|uniref:protein-L-isoaspartate(D-aspartate) O-methyltransferase n=1 Tax=Apiospora phragmitis TaxID=2905665 RepID=A0ABR1VJ68_9PEZI
MAWRSSGSSNETLVENLWKHGLLTSPAVKDAFLRVDRAHYAPASPYEDSPQPIGHGATISAPHMHANAVEALLEYILPPSSSKNGEVSGKAGRPRRILDIGSGSGYLTHVLAELAGEDGVVVGVEHIRELKELGKRNMAKSPGGRALLESGRCRFRVGDGRKGWVEPSPREGLPPVGGHAGVIPAATTTQNDGDDAARDGGTGNGTKDEEGGWDAIHVGAAAEKLHEELVRQLRAPGRMFIPVGGRDGWDQYIWTVEKDGEGNVAKRRGYGVRYVPLTDAPGAVGKKVGEL